MIECITMNLAQRRDS